MEGSMMDFDAELLAAVVTEIDMCFEFYDRPDVMRLAMHGLLLKSLARVAETYEMHGVVDYPVDRGDGRNGYCNLVWLRDGVPAVAFELNNQFRKKSLYKLRATGAPLMFWVFLEPVDYNPMGFRDVVIVPKRRRT